MRQRMGRAYPGPSYPGNCLCSGILLPGAVTDASRFFGFTRSCRSLLQRRLRRPATIAQSLSFPAGTICPLDFAGSAAPESKRPILLMPPVRDTVRIALTLGRAEQFDNGIMRMGLMNNVTHCQTSIFQIRPCVHKAKGSAFEGQYHPRPFR